MLDYPIKHIINYNISINNKHINNTIINNNIHHNYNNNYCYILQQTPDNSLTGLL